MIRSINDIMTFEEALLSEEYDGYDEFDPDYTRDMAEAALKNGSIRVYSSYPIEQGVFVTPSIMEAEVYSGDGNIYSKDVAINNVAWIDITQGQYAEIENTVKYSQKEHIDVDEFKKEEYTYPKLRKTEYRHLKSEILTNFPRIKNVKNVITLSSTNSRYYYIMDDDYNVMVLDKTKIKNIHDRKEIKNVDRERNDISSGFKISKRRYGYNRDSNGRNGNRGTTGFDDKFTEKALSAKGYSNERGYGENDIDDFKENRKYSIKEQPIDYNALLEENEELSSMNEDLKNMLEITSSQNEKLKNEFRKNRNDIISVQSNFSLNQSFDNDSQAESFFYNEANNFENPIVFKLFLQNLEEEYFFICQDYIDGLGDTDIIAKYNFEKDDFIEKKKYIRKKLIEYIDIY